MVKTKIERSYELELCKVAKDYLATKRETTAKLYRSDLRKFSVWYDGTLEDFLNEIYAEMGKPVLEQDRIVETTISEWVKWLVEKGYAPKSVRRAFSALQNFLKYYRVPVEADWVNLPAAVPLKKNKKHEWKLEHIKKFVEAASNYRDKALIMCLFQSGQGISEIIDLDYSDVREELEAGTLPLCFDLVRGKTGVQYKAFLGRDAIKYLKLYLETRQDLDDNSPLFTMLGSEKRVTIAAVEKRFREYAAECSFVNDNGGYNPARPHSLRSAFKSRLINKMDGDLIEFLMGHNIGEVKDAYLKMPTDELRELYASFERRLAIEKTSKDELAEIDKSVQITEELEAKVNNLKSAVTRLAEQNEALRDDLGDMKQRFNKLNDLILRTLDTDPELLQEMWTKIVEEQREREVVKRDEQEG